MRISCIEFIIVLGRPAKSQRDVSWPKIGKLYEYKVNNYREYTIARIFCSNHAKIYIGERFKSKLNIAFGSFVDKLLKNSKNNLIICLYIYKYCFITYLIILIYY